MDLKNSKKQEMENDLGYLCFNNTRLLDTKISRIGRNNQKLTQQSVVQLNL